jgi:hypothetical protein
MDTIVRSTRPTDGVLAFERRIFVFGVR